MKNNKGEKYGRRKKDNLEFGGRSLQGYIPSPPDDRDYTLETVCAVEDTELPDEYRTEGNVPVLNQGANSDCVAHAIAVATAYGQYKSEKSLTISPEVIFMGIAE